MSKQKEKEKAKKQKETNRLMRLERKENKSKKKNSVDFESDEMIDDLHLCQIIGLHQQKENEIKEE